MSSVSYLHFLHIMKPKEELRCSTFIVATAVPGHFRTTSYKQGNWLLLTHTLAYYLQRKQRKFASKLIIALPLKQHSVLS